MKIFKILFAVLFLSTMFLACETSSVDEEVGLELEINEEIRGEDDEGSTRPIS